MAAFRLSSRGATRLTLAVALGGTALVALLQPKGMSAPAPAAAAAAMLLPGDTTIIYGPRTFTTPTGSAVNFTERFNMTVVPGKRYFLRLVNGDPSGGHRVTAGQVRFNGWQVISGAELASGATIQKVVTARSTDTVFATVQGTAGAYVTVSVLETADPTFLVFGPGHFIRGTGTPVTETRTFAISPTAAPPYYFCLTNGDVNGANRVSAATVLINGQQVFVPANFNQQVSTLTAQVSLQPTNTMSVTLSGKPAGFVDICVTATDVTPPVITITAPPPNFITRDTTVTVSGTIQDETPTTVTINGIAATVTNSGFSKVIPLPLEGNNTIHIVAKDRAGLITDSVRTVIRDRTPPVLTVNAPVDGFVTNQATVVVSGTVQDLTAVTVRVNGTPLTVGQGGAFSGSVTLTEGVNQLTITATDAATNATSVVRSVRLDTHPPVLTIIAPVEGLLTNQTSVAVSGSVTDESAVTVTVNGAPLTVGAGGVISGSAALIEDANTLAFVATDAAGNQTPVTRNVTRDTQAPVLTVTAPAEGFLTNQTSVVVSGTATDAHTVTVNVNGTSLPVGQGGAFSGSVALTEGHNTLTVTATDAAGNSSSEVRHVIRDTIAPALVVTAPPDGFITNQASIVVSGTVFDSNAVTVTVDGVQLNVGQDGSFSGSVSLPVVHNTLIITATDAAGNAAPTVTRSGISDTQNPIIAVSQPGEGDTIATASVTVVGTVTDSTPVHLTVNGAPVPVGQNGAFTTSVDLVIGANTIVLVATDTALNDTTFERHVVRKNPLPPDPSLVASVVNPAEATLMQQNTSFLYAGTSPIQTGMTDSIQFLRAAVLRGRVLDRQLQPLGGAVVKIKNHSEFGQTLSREDGRYDLAVNGGGSLVLDFTKGGYLPAQRAADVPWQDYTSVDDVILLQPDTAVTVVNLGAAGITVARASVQSDSDGARQPALFFEEGTQATLRRADGTTQNLTTLSVRATEFTVGSNGEAAMPAALPPSSQYTYAIQVTADEQFAAGAGAKITFSQPVPLYVENFLDLDSLKTVPVGVYDPDSARWLPQPNGLMVKIMGTDAQGRAILDINGDGIADSDSLLVFNGIDPVERIRLAGTFPANSRLWRVPIIETLPYDLNWPFVLLGGDAPKTRVTGPCGSEGADVLRCSLQVQTAFQSVGIVGSPFTLNYASDRTQGNVADRQLKIQLTGKPLPGFLQRVDLDIDIAGKHFDASFNPDTNLFYTFVWDGKDGYGRVVQSTQPALVRISYMYPVVYAKPAPVAQSFGLPCLEPTASCTNAAVPPPEEDVRALRRVAETIQTTLGGFDAQGAGLGGFTLDVQHAYDPLGGILYGGDGTRRIAATLPDQITRFAGTGNPADIVQDNVAATQSGVNDPNGILVTPDGSVYFADRVRNRVRKVSPSGIITTVAGVAAFGYNGDNRLATTAQLNSPSALALGRDGSVYISDAANQRIRRIGTDDTIRAVAGTGTCGFAGDAPVVAATAAICQVVGIAVGPDGSLYFAESFNNRIRKIGLDGILRTVAGKGGSGGGPCFLAGSGIAAPGQFESICGEGIPATQALLRNPTGLGIGPDGTVYFGNQGGGQFSPRIRRIDPAGFIYVFAGGDVPLTQLGDGGPAKQAQLFQVSFSPIAVGPDGSVYFATEGATSPGYNRVRRVRPDGLISTVVGDGTAGSTGDNGPARRARVQRVEGIAFQQDGSMLISDDAKVRKVSPPLPGLAGGQQVIASANGSELYVFSPAGRILLTLQALTRDTIHTFSYNSQRQLVAVRDRDRRTLAIERNAQGLITAIVAPDGSRTELTLNGDGTLASSSFAGNSLMGVSYAPGGLIAASRDAGGITATRTSYDASGRVIEVIDTTSGPVTISDSTQGTTDFIRFTGAEGSDVLFQILNGIGSTAGTATVGGLSSQVELQFDGQIVTHDPDGTVTTRADRGDPLLGMQAPLLEYQTAMPSGLTLNVRTGRAAVLGNELDPSSLVSRTDSLFRNGRLATHLFDRATRTGRYTSPQGRVQVYQIDSRGRALRDSAVGMRGVNASYDSSGNLTAVIRGNREWHFAYDSAGHRLSASLPEGQAESYTYDARGRVTTRTGSGNRVTHYTYDDNGNVLNVTPPGRPPHVFTYTLLNDRATYTPPGGAATSFAYDLERRVERIARPDGSQIDFTYDQTGRLTNAGSPLASISWTYHPTTGITSRAIRSNRDTILYSFDGRLPTRIEWKGTVTGSVGARYDSDFRLSRDSAGTSPWTVTQYSYDNDGLPLSAGALSITRNASHGAVSRTTLISTTTDYTLNQFGEDSVRSFAASGTTPFRQTYVRDALGRLASLKDSILGQLTSYAFGYDSAGRLSSVTRNGVVDASYEYDDNDNLIRVVSSAGTTLGTVNVRDQLLSFGTSSFTYAPTGERTARIVGADTTRYVYDPFGNLVAVRVSSGDSIEYVIDAENRRIGRKVNGALRDGFLYTNGITGPVAQLDSLSVVIARFVYASNTNVPDYMVTATGTYKLVTDHLGTVRLVVDAQSGAIAQRLDYDAFGQVLSDSRPGFQPFGFAGGLYDPQTGLVRFGARDYDPFTGRFTAPDPILFDGSQTNLYAYASNNPVSTSDPTGLCNNYSECTVVVGTQGTLVGAGANVVIRNLQGFARAYTAIIEITHTAAQDIAILEAEAAEMYPRLMNMAAQWHHIIPKYLGGAANGLLVRIPAAYHQLITNAFRAEWAYGQAIPSADRLMQILINVYTRYPIPLLPWR